MRQQILGKKTNIKRDCGQMLEYVYGVHPVRELLYQRKRTPLALCSSIALANMPVDIANKALELRIQIRFVSRQELARLCGNNDHQSIVALVKPFVYRSKPFSVDKQPFIILLDGVQDVRNVGAIVRSVYCVGAHGVVLPVKGVGPLNAVALKASAGLAERIPILRSVTAVSAAQQLKKDGYQLLIASLSGISIEQIAISKPLCLVIGSEGSGISHAVAKLGIQCTLSQKMHDVSYNASVAAGILLYNVATRLKIL